MVAALQPAQVGVGEAADDVVVERQDVVPLVDGGSANGTLVVPHMTFRGVPIRNIRMMFENGRMTKMLADTNGEMLQQNLDSSSPNSKNLSVVDFGLNPHSQPLPGSHYYSWEMGGMVTLAMGNNAWAGGDNDADGGLSVHVPDASVIVDGQKLVEDGRLESKLQVP